MKIHIIGHGNQARAWAENLQDSGVETLVCLRRNSQSWKEASNKFKVISLEEIPEDSILALLIPDEAHPQFLEEISQTICKATIIYAHGFSLTANQLQKRYPHFNHLLFAPKAIASAVRTHYLQGKPLGAFISLEYSKTPAEDEKVLNDLADGIGITTLYHCTFDQETTADLFSEQSILCSLLPYAANSSFNRLVQNGIPKELAYFECWYEIKLIADIMVKLGPEKFFDLISPNALLGSQLGKEVLLGINFQQGLEQLLENIKNKKFETMVSDADMASVKNKVHQFWNEQELTQVHRQLAPELYKE